MAKEQMTRLDKQIGELEETVAKEFHKHGERFHSIEVTLRKHGERFHSIEATLRNHGERFHSIEATLRNHGERFRSVEATLVKHGEQLGSIGGRLDALQSDIQTIKDGFKVMDGRVSDGFRDIASRLDRLASRRPRSRRSQ